jgi:tetratricopeptide (TPR) repeat protein
MLNKTVRFLLCFVCAISVSCNYSFARRAQDVVFEKQFALATEMQELELYDVAIDYYALAYDMKHDSDVLFRIARILRQQGREKRALKIYKRALEDKGTAEFLKWQINLASPLKPELEEV